MKTKLNELPLEVSDRLKKIQQAPDHYAGYYQKDYSRIWPILGLITAIVALSGAFALIQEGEFFEIYIWIPAMALVSWIALASFVYLRRLNKAAIKPYLFINPLYFIRVDLDEVTYYNIWKERKDLKATHHYTNGSYNYTEFLFQFTNGSSESFNISPKQKAENFNQMLADFGANIADYLEKEDYSAVLSHDIFFVPDGQAQKSDPNEMMFEPSSKPRTLPWAMMIGGLLGLLFYVGNCYFYQARLLSYISTPKNGERFLLRFSYNFFADEARKKMVEIYQQQFERDKKSAGKLRQMIQIKECRGLTDEQQAQVLKLYRQQGKLALKVLYDQATANYRQVSQKNNPDPQAQAAVLEILKVAKDQDNYHVKIEYKSTTVGIDKPFYATVKLAGNKTVKRAIVPMTLSFTKKRNHAREQAINNRIKQSFLKIIPEDILQFGANGQIKFDISYTLFPSKYFYFLTKEPALTRKYYKGIKFLWHFQIIIKGKTVYSFKETSEPPAQFKVRGRSFVSRYLPKRSSISAANIYDRMAETSFDNFSAKILKHFGIMKSIRQEQADSLAKQMQKKLSQNLWCSYYKGHYYLYFSWFKKYTRGIHEIRYSWEKPELNRYWIKNGHGSPYLDVSSLPQAKGTLYLQIKLVNKWTSPSLKYAINLKTIGKDGREYIFYPR